MSVECQGKVIVDRTGGYEEGCGGSDRGKLDCPGRLCEETRLDL